MRKMQFSNGICRLFQHSFFCVFAKVDKCKRCIIGKTRIREQDQSRRATIMLHQSNSGRFAENVWQNDLK
jgi:hypothetical protein